MNSPLEGSTVHDLVSAQARRHPDSPAISMGTTVVSYRELDAWSDGIAERVVEFRARASGDPAGEPAVAVATHRTPAYPAAVLGVLKAGCAYVPLDLSYPADRQEIILRDSRVMAVLVDDPDATSIADVPPIVIPPSTARASACFTTPTVTPSDPAYIMFTSGSTGRPKGVLVEHRQVTSLMRLDPRVRIGQRHRVAMLAPPAFDASTFELWNTLGGGGELVVLDRGWDSVSELGSRLRESGLDWLFLTTGLFHLLAEYDPAAFDSVGTVITGGDVLAPHHVRSVAARRTARVLAAYGPTETTTFASLHEVDPSSSSSPVPIGTPLAGATLKIIAADGTPAASGETGELHIGGSGVARGYLDPLLTAQKFLTSDSDGTRWYRSGDLARQLPNGEYEFHGRTDRQVKVRGHRVELGEIELELLNHPAVSAAVVAAVSDADNHTRIAAYVVPTGNGTADLADIRSWILGRLPAFMEPAIFVAVPAIPLDGHGKPDRRALPDPWTRRQDMPELPPYRPPLTGLERRIATAWADSIGLDVVGLDDDFRDLGGDSLKSVDLLARLERQGIAVAAVDFFRNPTVGSLAKTVAELAGDDSLEAGDLSVERSARVGTTT